MKHMVVLIMLCLALYGCESGGCIKVGGSYQGVAGDVEYCFGGKGTGAPSFTEKTEDGTEKEFFGFTEDQLNELLDKLKGIGIKTMSADEEKKHPAVEILELLEVDHAKQR